MASTVASVVPWVAASALFLYGTPMTLGAKAMVNKMTTLFGLPKWLVHVIGFGEVVAGALQVAALALGDADSSLWLAVHAYGAFLAVSFLAGGAASHILRDEDPFGALPAVISLLLQLLGSYCHGTWLLPVLAGIAVGPFTMLLVDSFLARKDR
mmetsp:Transcript_31446/g.77045  ORF Transcript_31446/g.77045 Transcript_31446/m.77045 type:complete len:154 (+) Transcript_31446:96-557(+)